MKTDELTFDNLHCEETLLLETSNNVYRFSVIDAANGVGKLSGGIFGDCPTTASFFSCVSAQEDYQLEEVGKVKVGSRAVFLYQSTEGIHHFVTSPILKLTHAK